MKTLLRAIALTLAVSTFLRAVTSVAFAWDVWYYHLPFAARIAGVVPASVFAFHPANEHRFRGFPLLGEALQGFLWRATGRPEAANLVAWGSLAVYVAFLRGMFRVPWHLTTIALLAIPLVMTHATSGYVDLPANLAVSALILLVYRLWTDPFSKARGNYVLAILVAAAVAANMRFQLLPVVALALVVAAPRLMKAQSRIIVLAVACVFAVVVFATPLKNLAVHHNPFYPLRMTLFGIALPGAEGTYSDSPPSLEHAARPVRFAYSLLEIGIRPLSDDARWTVDQYMHPSPGGNRMGGFFGAYVVLALAGLGLLVLRDRSRPARGALVVMGVISLVVSFMPQSHELRYYLFWMIVLVSLCLVLASREGAATARLAVSAAATVVLFAVLLVTRAWFVYPSPYSFTELLKRKVNAAAIESISEGETVCVSHAPWSILYAPTFHTERPYKVREAEDTQDCTGARLLE